MTSKIKQFITHFISTVIFTACVALTFTTSYAGEDEWDDFEKKVKKELRSKKVEDQINAIKSFETHDYEDAGEFLIKYAYKVRKEAQLAETAGEVLSTYENTETRELLKKYVTKSPGSCLPLLTAYFSQPSAETNTFAQLLLNKSSSKSPELTQAIRHIGLNPSADAKLLEKLSGLLVEKTYHSLRRASAEALGGLENINAVPVLIPYVDDLVINTLAQDALFRLTGQQFNQNKTEWTKWWESNKTSEAAKKSAEESDKQRDAIIAKDEKVAKENGGNKESFYGVPITGKSILFILDHSGSMSSNGRMDKMKQELYYMIASINENRNFGFVLFPHDAYPGKGVSKASESFKRRANKYVEKLEPTGSTPITEAMEYAFKRVIAKNNVDTIYLLSDGAPNKPAAEVRALIKGLNGGLYVQIHTVSIGADSQFLKDVAADNQGTYNEVK